MKVRSTAPRWRSLLFVAADDHARLANIAGRGADAVILDLEDAVPVERKPDARQALAGVVDELFARSVDIVVRINQPWRDALADLEAAVRPGVSAIMLPKAESAATLSVLAEIVGAFATEKACSSPGIIALLESPAGIAQARVIAAVDGVIGLALGSEDFSLSLAVPPTPECLDLPCRQIALAAAEYGRMALGLPVSITTIRDEPGWRSAAEMARAVGMTGALCIHPRQVEIVNDVFSVSPEQQAHARAMLDAWEGAGRPALFTFDGKMVDRPVLLAAKRLVSNDVPDVPSR